MIKLLKRNQKGAALIELLITFSIIATISSCLAPLYISNLNKAKTIADTLALESAMTLASSMYIMEDTIEGTPIDRLTSFSPAYYKPDGELTLVKNGLLPYGKEDINKNCVVIVYYDHDKLCAEWISVQ